VTTQSVDKAIAILEQFSTAAPQLGVSELARRLHLTKSTVHRLLRSLVKGGMVEQDPRNRRYMLGRKAVQLGYTAIYSDPLLHVALPYLHYLAHDVGEAAYLAERSGYEAAPVLQVLSPIMQEQLNWSTTIPLHSTSAGKVLLAYAEEAEQDTVLSRRLPRRTERTVTDPAELRTQLQRVREEGFASSYGEDDSGYNGIGVPVWNPQGQVVAALAIAGPSYRLTRDQALASVEKLKAISGEITRKLESLRRG
jgi:IclR family acetate operon transcriptional repressor